MVTSRDVSALHEEVGYDPPAVSLRSTSSPDIQAHGIDLRQGYAQMAIDRVETTLFCFSDCLPRLLSCPNTDNASVSMEIALSKFPADVQNDAEDHSVLQASY